MTLKLEKFMSSVILEWLNNLAATSKRKEKESLLIQYKDDLLFRAVLLSALDERKVYHIQDIPEPATSNLVEDVREMDLPTAIGQLPSLMKRQVTGNDAINFVSLILGSLSPDDREVFKRILTKDLRCGVGIKTVNAAFGSEFIYDHPYMRYQSYNEKNMKRIRYPAYQQMKIDGLYIDMIFQKSKGPDNSLIFMTRNGRELLIPQSIRHSIHEDLVGDQFRDVVFQGEGIIIDKDGNDTKRQDSNGIFYSLEGLEKEKENVRFKFWDCVPYSDFVRKKCDLRYDERLEALFDLANVNSTYCEVVPGKIVYSEEEAYELYDSYLNDGHEGAVVKNMDITWKDGMTNGGVKMKPVKEADLVVIGYNPGEGKYSEGIGSLICKTSDDLVLVGVAGLSDAQRGVESVKDDDGNVVSYKAIEGFDKDKYNGKIITVLYNEVIVNDKNPDLYSLFLTRAKKADGEIVFRLDKSEADTYEDLITKEKGG